MPRKVIETPEQLSNTLDYNPDTGEIRFISNGKLAGWNKDGYIRIGKHQIYAHRIAYYKMTGEWPNEIDHINKIRSDNRWVNLRNCSHTENTRNIDTKKNNRTGVLHVHINGSGYDVRVGKFFRRYTRSFEEACTLAREAREKYYGEYS